MIVENGEFYQDAKGEKRGPVLRREPNPPLWHYLGSRGAFRSDGTSLCGLDPDLIRKWVDPDTLKNLGVKPGDVVECANNAGWGNYTNGKRYKVSQRGLIEDDNGSWIQGAYSKFRLVSRASDTPPIFKDMSDAEQGALLLAKHRGKRIEYWDSMKWELDDDDPSIYDDVAYRIAPTRIHGSVETDADGSPDFSTWEADQ